jgi:predicted lipoprotein with Yx(FWY)xxD motif
VRYAFAAVAAAISAASLAAGCGSSSSSSTATTTPAQSSATQSTAAPAAASPAYPASSTSAAAAAPVLITTKSNKLGTILAAGAKQRTVYLFEADKPGQSACSGACTQVWPPVTAAAAKSGGGAMAADLGTIARSDGTKQVTYKGHPLYLFARDGDKSDAYGQGVKGFGASWYVLSPSGSKVDHS